jgi:alpha-L-rhamnosidase
MKKINFITAKPVWILGREKEKNLMAGFRAVFNAEEYGSYTLRIAGSSLYRIYLNNEFLGYGPARGPHEFYRVDEWDLKEKLREGQNLLAIEVAGYNINGYYLLCQDSFLQAEVLRDGVVLASTNGDGENFKSLIIKERVQKVQKFSFQRPFIEVYRLNPGYDKWRKEVDFAFKEEKPAVQKNKNLIRRGVSYPKFSVRPVLQEVSSTNIEIDINKTEFHKERELTNIGPDILGYLESELEVIPSIELQKLIAKDYKKINKPCNNEKVLLKEYSSKIFDLGTNLTGFIGTKINCKKDTLLYVVFDELLINDDIDTKRAMCVNCLTYYMAPGEYNLESFELCTGRYIKLIVMNGECDINGIYMREYANPEVHESHFSAADHELNKLFEAARETFRQNSVDIFMDCPGRERAGWLCDSFFTSRVAMDISGNTKIERNFLENFLLPGKFKYHPDGMLPMCYPAEHFDGRFIPNWAMWFVVELEEYLFRSGDRKMVDALKDKVINLLNYFEKLKNEDGLLEKLEKWIFVEWSKANDFVQDVNYPSNMLYASTLEAAGRLYNIEKYINEAKDIKNTIRRQSFNGEFFIDNAVRNEGKLEVTKNTTEVCQYYAFFFGIADPENYPELWKKLVSEFGPKRDAEKTYPLVYRANAFIGNYLRFELLSRYNCAQSILKEVKDYFLYMAESTGTLWEFVDSIASCNQGFASHVAHILYRDILGLYKIDYTSKKIVVKFSDLPLEWCEGRIPLGNNFIFIKWWKKNNKLYYKVIPPFGYTVEIISDMVSECSL